MERDQHGQGTPNVPYLRQIFGKISQHNWHTLYSLFLSQKEEASPYHMPLVSKSSSLIHSNKIQDGTELSAKNGECSKAKSVSSSTHKSASILITAGT
jgi:hypothetical protein